MNQNPEQLERDRIDDQLTACGWTIQNKSSINLHAGIGVPVQEYRTDVGPADYVLLVDKKPVGIIEAKRAEEGVHLTVHEEQSHTIRFDESPVFLDLVDKKVLQKSLLQISDVIVTQTGTREKRDYGFTALIQKPNLLLNQRIAGIRFNKTYLPKFFLYYSWTDFFKDQFFANETGNVGQGNVGMKVVTETSIPFCSIEVQEEIIEDLESHLSVADKLGETIANNLQQAEVLRQSILKKAFEGQLIGSKVSL